MSGETDLAKLMHNLRPKLQPGTYVFCCVENAQYGDLSHTNPLACIAEPEGLTLVLTQQSADLEGLTYSGPFRCISLQVHSSLEAVGLTAAVASKLAAQNISANMIAGYYHDHVFVPASQATPALRLLQSMNEPLTA